MSIRRIGAPALARGKALAVSLAVAAAGILAVAACSPGEAGTGRLSLYGPGTDSGTFDYFTLAINGEEGASRTDFLPSEDDNVIAHGISGDRNSLGYFGYAYYAGHSGRLKLLAVDNGSGCVLPTPETINDGTYAPLSRPVFVYVSVASLERPEVRAFMDFYMRDGGQFASGAGYIALPPAVYEDNLRQIQEAAGGEAPGEPLSGSIEIDGSSTVFPVTQAAAEAFREAGNTAVQVTVAVSGTGGGFRRFVNGQTDISNASRHMTDAEKQLAAANGVEFIELQVALDGIAVMVNPDNARVDCLTTEELRRIWEPGSDVDRWSDVREEFSR